MTSLRLALLIITITFFALSEEAHLIPTEDEVKAKLALLEDGGDQEIQAIYRKILDLLVEKDKAIAATVELNAKMASVDDKLQQSHNQISDEGEEIKAPQNLKEAVSGIERIDEKLKELTAILAGLEAEKEINRLRLLEIQKQMVSMGQVTTAPPTIELDKTVELTEKIQAERLLLLTGSATQIVLRKKLEVESAWIQKAPVLNIARNTSVTKQIEQLTKQKTALTELAEKFRQAEAEKSVESARTAVGEAESSAMKKFAKLNFDLASKRSVPTGVLKKLADAVDALASRETDLRKLNAQSESVKTRVELLSSAGLSIDPETGYMFSQQRGAIISSASLKKAITSLVKESTSAHLELLKLEEAKREFILDQNQMELSGGVADSKTLELLKNRQEIYTQLIDDYRKYTETVDKHLTVLKEYRLKSISHKRYMDERMLWIRSSLPLDPNELYGEVLTLNQSYITTQIKRLSIAVNKIAFSNPYGISAAILAWIILILRRKRITNRISTLGAEAKDETCDRLSVTVETIVLSLLAGLLIPSLLWLVVWYVYDLSPDIGKGLKFAAIFLTLFGVLRILVRKDGLFEAHFGFKPEKNLLIYKNVSRLVWIAPPLIFMATVLPGTEGFNQLGTVCFIVTMLVTSYFMHRLFRPPVKLLPIRRKHLWATRLIHFLLVFLPLLLAVGAAAGYFNSVQLLRVKIATSVWVTFLISLAASFILRWMLVNRRRFQKQEAAKMTSALSDDSYTPTPEEIIEKANRLEISRKNSRRLIKYAAATATLITIWTVWASTFPSLQILDKVTLWDIQPSGDSMASSTPIPLIGGSSAASTSGDKINALRNDGRVSLQNLLFSIVFLCGSIVTAVKIPSILELLFLQRVKLQQGTAFAIKTTLRYLIIGIGVAIASAHIGIDWGKIQWIAAAITLGIGFGLQEVFANFVAGIIILFERPIRLGDYVTIADISGQVSKIQIRATTIRDFSNKELVVPNKEFITGKLVNWTLTDPVIRIELPVGIAYGSDTALAKKVLEEVGRKNKLILQDRPPQAVFLSFGDSSLNFELRVHVTGSDDLIRTRSQLNFAIDEAFRKAGIEIAFPQRDIHIRSLPKKTTESAGEEPTVTV